MSSSFEKPLFDENADKNLSAVVHFSVEYLSGLTFKRNHKILAIFVPKIVRFGGSLT